ncbi:hypothetical protein [Neobacillus drentensis]|uniref:hypothetical protein n=1 Tax=Neobacillus drentensis TaxID=220684 RepID=UPI003B58A1E9
MKREVLEETGIEIEVIKNLGVIDFMLPWEWEEYSRVHHSGVTISIYGRWKSYYR